MKINFKKISSILKEKYEAMMDEDWSEIFNDKKEYDYKKIIKTIKQMVKYLTEKFETPKYSKEPLNLDGLIKIIYELAQEVIKSEINCSEICDKCGYRTKCDILSTYIYYILHVFMECYENGEIIDIPSPQEIFDELKNQIEKDVRKKIDDLQKKEHEFQKTIERYMINSN